MELTSGCKVEYKGVVIDFISLWPFDPNFAVTYSWHGFQVLPVSLLCLI